MVFATGSITYVFVALVVAVVGAALAGIPRHRRRQLFRRRPRTDFDAWFSKHYAGSEVSRDAALIVIRALADEIDCDESQIMPSDEIAGTLSITPSMPGLCDSFETADMALKQQLSDRGVGTPLDNRDWNTIDDVIRAVDRALRESATRTREES